jgi:hypothetical protein
MLFGWIVLMLATGSTIGLLATPAAGPILGWLLEAHSTCSSAS